MNRKTADVLIIGGGVIGSSIAYHLALEGVRVVQVERRAIAAEASGASAGGVRQLNRPPAEQPLALAAIRRWAGLEDELDADLEYHRDGGLRLAMREDDASSLRGRIERQRAGGFPDIGWLDADGCKELIPELGDGFLGGAYSPSDGHANAPKTTAAFARAAVRRGADLVVGVSVDRIRVSSGSVVGAELSSGSTIATERVVNAAGLWHAGPVLDGEVQLRVPARPFIHQMTGTMPDPVRRLAPVVGLEGERLSLKQLSSGSYMIGGGWHAATSDLGSPYVHAEHLEAAVATASKVIGAVGRQPVERVWFGHEAHCVDELPVLGEVDGVAGYLVATAFSGHGFAISPAVGEVMTDLALGRPPRHDIQGLRYDRFGRTGDAGDVEETEASAG